MSQLCQCESAEHFTTPEYGPQTGHDYQVVLGVVWVVLLTGAVCDECAASHMAPYLVSA